MPIRSTCSNCRMQADWPDASRGQRVNCQVCGAAIVVGAPPGASPLQPAAVVAGGNWAAQPSQSSGMPAVLIIGGIIAVVLTIVIALGAAAYLFIRRASGNAPRQTSPIAQPAFGNAPAPQTHRPTNPTTHAWPEQTNTASRPNQGVPPSNVPSGKTPAAGQAGVEIELSDARTNSSGARKGFSVRYKFTRGAPQPGVWLHWVIKSADGKLYTDQLAHFQLGSEGTLGGSAFEVGRGNQEPFEMWIEMGSPSPFAEKTKVSNTITTVVGDLAGGDSPHDAMRKRHEQMVEESRKRMEELRNRRPGSR